MDRLISDAQSLVKHSLRKKKASSSCVTSEDKAATAKAPVRAGPAGGEE